MPNGTVSELIKQVFFLDLEMRPKASLAADDEDDDNDEDVSFTDTGFSDDEEPQDEGVRREIRNKLRSIQSQATRKEALKRYYYAC